MHTLHYRFAVKYINQRDLIKLVNAYFLFVNFQVGKGCEAVLLLPEISTEKTANIFAAAVEKYQSKKNLIMVHQTGVRTLMPMILTDFELNFRLQYFLPLLFLCFKSKCRISNAIP